MTQRDVGERCGLTFQQIQKYEAGLIAMPIARLIAIAEALEAPVGDFIQGLPASPPASADREVVDWRLVSRNRELSA
jgi:transcriptional regulator with XRE-family HTH domain